MADTVSYTGETRLGDSPVYLVEKGVIRTDTNACVRVFRRGCAHNNNVKDKWARHKAPWVYQWVCPW